MQLQEIKKVLCSQVASARNAPTSQSQQTRSQKKKKMTISRVYDHRNRNHNHRLAVGDGLCFRSLTTQHSTIVSCRH